MSATSPRALCAHFGYPPALGEALAALVEAARRHLGDERLRSVMLGGSLPRGELSALRDAEGRLELLSDIDAALFVHSRDPAREARLREEIEAIERHVGARTPLFHMDAGVHRLFAKRPTIWTYEMRMGALTLYGEDLRRLLPRVTRYNLDLGNTAELVLVRLWNQLLHCPLAVVEGRASGLEEAVFRHVTARNTLELPTILLARHGVLRPGYAARQRWLEHNGPLAAAFGPAFVGRMARALAEKRTPGTFAADPVPLTAMLDDYERLLAHLAGRPETNLDALDDEAIEALYQEGPWLQARRRALELALRLRRWRGGDSAAARGYGRAPATRFLLALHRALAERREGGDGDESLARAERLAGAMGYRSGAASWPARWQSLREWFVALHGQVLFKGDTARIDHLLETVRWRG